MTSKILTLLIAGAALVAAPAAFAGQAPAPRQAVSTAGLNLNTGADAAVMLHRIRLAAVEVCKTANGSGNDIQSIEGFDDCYGQTVRNGVASLSAPLVTQALQQDQGAATYGVASR